MNSKYRAWDKENNQMIYPDSDGVCFEIDDDGIDVLDISGDWPDIGPFPMLDSVLMKCVGIEGTNEGEEGYSDVFQHDIVDIFWEDCPMGYYRENHIVGIVDLDKTGTAWIIKNAKYDYDTPTPIPNEIDDISISGEAPSEEDLEEIFLHNFNLTENAVTILGNIYENPELLKED